MPLLTPAHLRQQIATNALGPLYLLTGEDEAERTRLTAELVSTVDESLRAFNVERLYGGEAAVSDLLAVARTLPFAASRRIVVVLRAERLLVPRRESERTDQEQEALAAYLQAPVEHATVVFVAADKLDERRKVVKLLQREAGVVVCAGVADAGEAARWVRNRVKEEGRSIDPEAVRVLVERAGTDIRRLRADTDRVLLYAAGEKTIAAGHVRDVTAPAVSQDDWAVTRAIGQGNAGTALRELALLLEAGAVPYMVLGQLGWYVRNKMPPAQVSAAVEALFRTDLALKSSGGEPRVLLERLVVELCGAGPGSAAGRR